MEIDRKIPRGPEKITEYLEQVEDLAFSYLEKGRSFDLVHTEYGLEILKQNEDELNEDIYKILFFSFALHDIGYSLLDETPEGYENIKKQKQAHAILGSEEAEKILSSKPYSNILNKEERKIICELILHHDEVESVVDYIYKDFETGRYLMSLDTLGAFLAIQNGEATFSKEELDLYLRKNTERRGGRIHDMLTPLFEQTLGRISKGVIEKEKDFSFLLVKPEAIERIKEIEEHIKKRGYEILTKTMKNNWRETARIIYHEFPPEAIETYIQGYNKHKFDDNFFLLILRHQDGETLKKLKKEQGSFIAYQTHEKNSLRAEFGLSPEYNVQHEDVTFVYCGIHCPDKTEELKSQLKLFSLPNRFK